MTPEETQRHIADLAAYTAARDEAKMKVDMAEAEIVKATAARDKADVWLAQCQAQLDHELVMDTTPQPEPVVPVPGPADADYVADETVTREQDEVAGH